MLIAPAANLQSIIAYTGEDRSSSISFITETEKIDLYWMSSQVAASILPTRDAWDMLSTPFNATQTVAIFTAYIGYFNCDMQLIPISNSSSSGSNRFETSFSYNLGGQHDELFIVDSLSRSAVSASPILASTGTSMSTFKLAAALLTRTPGLY